MGDSHARQCLPSSDVDVSGVKGAARPTGSENCAHVIRSPWRWALQPWPVRSYPDLIQLPPPRCTARSTLAVAAPAALILASALRSAMLLSSVTPLALPSPMSHTHKIIVGSHRRMVSCSGLPSWSLSPDPANYGSVWQWLSAIPKGTAALRSR
jgi:hypothetical protein